MLPVASVTLMGCLKTSRMVLASRDQVMLPLLPLSAHPLPLHLPRPPQHQKRLDLDEEHPLRPGRIQSIHFIVKISGYEEKNKSVLSCSRLANVFKLAYIDSPPPETHRPLSPRPQRGRESHAGMEPPGAHLVSKGFTPHQEAPGTSGSQKREGRTSKHAPQGADVH